MLMILTLLTAFSTFVCTTIKIFTKRMKMASYSAIVTFSVLCFTFIVVLSESTNILDDVAGSTL
jgi:hypothetical protein